MAHLKADSTLTDTFFPHQVIACDCCGRICTEDELSECWCGVKTCGLAETNCTGACFCDLILTLQESGAVMGVAAA
jgi:hypothetical protein